MVKSNDLQIPVNLSLLHFDHELACEASGSVTVPATLDQLDTVMDLIHAELKALDCPMAVKNQLDIAIEEMFVNVCHYAYADNDDPGMCTVSYLCHLNPCGIVVQIEDEGTPFNPLTRQDPTKPSSIQEAKIGGLGIFMTKKSVDELSYLRDDTKNVVIFRKAW